MTPIDDLITATTEDQFVDVIDDRLEGYGLKSRSWRKAGFFRTCIRVLAACCATFSEFQVRFIRSGFLELAEDIWLTWVAYYVYGVSRIEATFATGQATLTNLDGGDYEFQPGELRLIDSSTGKAFTNAAVEHLSPLATITIDVVAVEIGAASSSVAGAIDTVETYAGRISVTNAGAVIGSDTQLDADLRQACRDKLAARSKYGPRGAYAYAIRSATRDDGSAVDINKFSISPSSSTGQVTIFCRSPSGVPTDEDLDAVRASIEANARPDTVQVSVSAVTLVPISRTVTIWARKEDGLNATDLRTQTNAKVLDLQRTYPVGGRKKGTAQGYFLVDTLDGVIHAANPAIYAIDGLGSDVALDEGEIPSLTVTIDQVHIVDAEVH